MKRLLLASASLCVMAAAAHAQSCPAVTVADITERDGCAVHLDWDGNQFDGGTVGSDCRSTLRGASYATSEVTMDETEIRSWDRGYDDQDTQVWGAEAGPYIFVRQD